MLSALVTSSHGVNRHAKVVHFAPFGKTLLHENNTFLVAVFYLITHWKSNKNGIVGQFSLFTEVINP